MILLGNFLIASAKVLHILLMIYIWVVLIRALLSWANVPSLYPLAIVLYRLTEPVLRPFRKLLPPRRLGGFDLSPVIVILLAVFIDSFFVKSLALYGLKLIR